MSPTVLSHVSGLIPHVNALRLLQFPYCDGAHTKHNSETGDNVGPLIVKGKHWDLCSLILHCSSLESVLCYVFCFCFSMRWLLVLLEYQVDCSSLPVGRFVLRYKHWLYWFPLTLHFYHMYSHCSLVDPAGIRNASVGPVASKSKPVESIRLRDEES